MSLERLCHEHAMFVTLTYSPDGLFRNEMGHCSLFKRDLQLFLKRLRKAVDSRCKRFNLPPNPIRYFACGEYGDRGDRPHYHLIIYGLSPYFPADCDLVKQAWSDPDMRASYGRVEIRECVHDTIQYVAGYVVKKIVSAKDSRGRTPEFTLSSRKPGIGYLGLVELIKILQKPVARKQFGVLDNGVPGSLRVNGFNLPLGRYCMDKIKLHLWIDQELEKSTQNYLTEMAIRYFHTKTDYTEQQVYSRLADALLKESEQKVVNLTKRFKIRNRRSYEKA